MLERLLVEQRLGVARGEQPQVVPRERHHMLHHVVHGRVNLPRWMNADRVRTCRFFFGNPSFANPSP